MTREVPTTWEEWRYNWYKSLRGWHIVDKNKNVMRGSKKDVFGTPYLPKPLVPKCRVPRIFRDLDRSRV